MNKRVGLWIDHRKAVIVMIKDEQEELMKISSNMEKHVRFSSGDGSEDGSSEDVRDRKFGNHLNSYYDEVIAYIRDADSIQIFGQVRLKASLKNALSMKDSKPTSLPLKPSTK